MKMKSYSALEVQSMHTAVHEVLNTADLPPHQEEQLEEVLEILAQGEEIEEDVPSKSDLNNTLVNASGGANNDPL